MLKTIGIVKIFALGAQNLTGIRSLVLNTLGIVKDVCLGAENIGIGYGACFQNTRNRQAQGRLSFIQKERNPEHSSCETCKVRIFLLTSNRGALPT